MGAAMAPRVAARPLSLSFDLILCSTLGALQTAAFVYTEAWWLQLLCTALLAWRGSAVGPRRAAALGWCYGTAWLSMGTWWLFISLNRYGGLPAWMAALAVFTLAAFLSLYLAAAMAAFSRWRTGSLARDALLFAALWLMAELARGVLFTGFPWVASGYAHVDSPLASLAPWVGVYGIGAVAAGLAALAALSAARPQRPWAGLALATLALVAAASIQQRFTHPRRTLSVTLLQGNVPQDEKFATEYQGQALKWHIGALLAANSDLVVAPETAIPYLPQEMPPGVWNDLSERFGHGSAAALFGVPLGDEKTGYTNSAVGLAPGRPPYRYDKHHLVPFGEFIPTGFHWFVRMMNIPLGDFSRGAVNQPSFNVDGERVAPNICYEDLFGEELAARFRGPQNAPTVFANISNIGWFGDTSAIDQHLNISRMRALEFERPMLRATNTGATAVIDHRGHVTASLKPYTRGVLAGQVQGRDGLTPFAWWVSRFGLWPLALFAVALALAAGWRRRAAN